MLLVIVKKKERDGRQAIAFDASHLSGKINITSPGLRWSGFARQPPLLTAEAGHSP